MNKSTVEEIKERFDNDVERFSNLDTGQLSTIDAKVSLELITEASKRMAHLAYEPLMPSRFFEDRVRYCGFEFRGFGDCHRFSKISALLDLRNGRRGHGGLLFSRVTPAIQQIAYPSRANKVMVTHEPYSRCSCQNCAVLYRPVESPSGYRDLQEENNWQVYEIAPIGGIS